MPEQQEINTLEPFVTADKVQYGLADTTYTTGLREVPPPKMLVDGSTVPYNEILHLYLVNYQSGEFVKVCNDPCVVLNDGGSYLRQIGVSGDLEIGSYHILSFHQGGIGNNYGIIYSQQFIIQ